MKHTVSIIIVSYNRLNTLRDVLDGIARFLDMETTEVIVVDNASQEPVASTVRTQYPAVRLLALSENVGFGRGCNAGAQVATGEFVLFVNSDVLFRGNPLPAMIESFLDNASVGMAGVTLLNADGTKQPSAFRFPSLWLRLLQLTGLKAFLQLLLRSVGGRIPAAPDFVSGAFCMMRRTFFEEIGGFDERYFMYVEDADLGYRVHRREKTAILIPTDAVIHLGQHYEVPEIPFVFYHMNVGLLLFYRLHYGTMLTLILSAMSVAIFSLRWSATLIIPGTVGRRALYASVVKLYADAFRGAGAAGSMRYEGKDSSVA